MWGLLPLRRVAHELLVLVQVQLDHEFAVLGRNELQQQRVQVPVYQGIYVHLAQDCLPVARDIAQVVSQALLPELDSPFVLPIGQVQNLYHRVDAFLFILIDICDLGANPTQPSIISVYMTLRTFIFTHFFPDNSTFRNLCLKN